MNIEGLNLILEKHKAWLEDRTGGVRANLTGADLTRENLTGANLAGANLTNADLTRANLLYANLTGAYLTGVYLTDANLTGADLIRVDLTGVNLRTANLSGIKEDFLGKLKLAKNEVKGLYDYLLQGKVNGMSYTADCACFVGTIAKIAGEYYRELSSGLRPEYSSPTERWFRAIKEGDTPETNQVSKITTEWIEEFCKAEGIELTKDNLT